MKNRIYRIGIDLGLGEKDIDSLMSKSMIENENAYFSFGPPRYPGSFYGTVSIKDFIKM
jgi:hypothetical protein